MNGPINSGLRPDDYDTWDHPVPERVIFNYRRKWVPSKTHPGSICLIPWRGVVTFEAVALRDFDMYVKRGGVIAGYITMVPKVGEYQYGYALTDNAGNLIFLSPDPRYCQMHAISHLPSAAEQEAYQPPAPQTVLRLATRRDAAYAEAAE